MKILISIGTLGLGGAEKQAVWLANKLSVQHEVMLLTVRGGPREKDICESVDWIQIQSNKSGSYNKRKKNNLAISSVMEPAQSLEHNKTLEYSNSSRRSFLRKIIVTCIPRKIRTFLYKKFINNWMNFISNYHPYKFTHNLIKNSKPDIVVTFLFHDTLLVGLSAIFLKRRPKIVVGRRSPLGYGGNSRSYFQNKLLKLIYLICDSAISNASVNNLSAVIDGLSEEKITVIHNYVENSKSKLVPNTTKSFELLCVANFFDYKNHESFIRALGNFHFRSPYHVTFLGDGPLKLDMELLARNLGVNADFYSHDEQAALVQISVDYLVVPSFHEGNSNSLLESLVSGIPAIVTRVGIVNELEKMGAPLVITSGTDYLSIQESIAIALNDVTHKKESSPIL